MQEVYHWDQRSNEFMEGYVFATQTQHDIVLQFYAHADQLYCLERQPGIWEMIDTPTALEWGL